jgi:hypothetical protein
VQPVPFWSPSLVTVMCLEQPGAAGSARQQPVLSAYDQPVASCWSFTRPVAANEMPGQPERSQC